MSDFKLYIVHRRRQDRRGLMRPLVAVTWCCPLTRVPVRRAYDHEPKCALGSSGKL